MDVDVVENIGFMAGHVVRMGDADLSTLPCISFVFLFDVKGNFGLGIVLS